MRPVRLVLMMVIVSSLALPVLGAEEGDAYSEPGATGSLPARARTAHPPAIQRALEVLVEAFHGDNPYLRANAIEAIQHLPAKALPLVREGLSDPSPVVRFAAVVTAGQLGLESLKSAIRERLEDENPSVRAAAMYTLYIMGEDVNITPLAGMLRSENPGLRANVAMVMGLLGDRSAIPLLKSASTVPMPRLGAAQAAVVRVQIAAAIVRLGGNQALDPLRAALYSPYGEVRVLAVNALGAVGDQRMIPALAQMLGKQPSGRKLPVELRVAAAAALARMGEDAGIDTLLKQTTHEDPVVRAQAAWGLGFAGRGAERVVERLRGLLGDPSPQVCVTAAASLLRRAANPASSVHRASGSKKSSSPVDNTSSRG